MNKILLKNGLIYDQINDTPYLSDILIENEIITKIGSLNDINDVKIIDIKDKIVCPGFIDLQTHICESWKEINSALEEGTKVAVKGGFSTICAVSSINHPLDNEGMIGIIKYLSKTKGWSNVIPTATATQGLKGKAMSEIGMLINAGAGLVYDAMRTIEDPLLMSKLMEYIKMFDIPFFLHCEDTTLSKKGLINDGEISTRLGLTGIPASSEEIIVARDLILAEYHNMKIHIAHVSTKGSVRMIRDAKKRGIKVTCSTTPHHLDLIDEDIKDFNTNYKILPPLRSKVDREALINGIKDGTIDVISTDHFPVSIHSKSKEFEAAPFGIIGLETAFQILFDRLVKKSNIDLNLILNKLTKAPANILNIDKGILKEGNIADITIINNKDNGTITEENLISKSKNTPYIGKNFTTKIFACMVNGNMRFINDEFIY